MSGLCSGIVSSTTWATGIVTVEALIAKFETELNILERLVTSSVEALESLENQTEQAIGVMKRELTLVIQWESATINVENTLNDYTVEQMKKILAYQNTFKTSIEVLQTSAQAFFDNAAKETF